MKNEQGSSSFTTSPAERIVDVPGQSDGPEIPRWLKLMLNVLAYGIPLTFLAYVLYINYLPFGYEKTFTIDVGAEGDTDASKAFYLEPSRDLSERKIAEDGTTYRELNGIANVVFKPNVFLKDAEITVEVDGEGISLIPPYLDFDPAEYEWDYSWDFGTSVPQDLIGNAFVFDGEVVFNGRDTRLELPNSTNLFETGPLTLYAEWTPRDSISDAQQIIGHFNWELWQNSDSVEFFVGRMNNATGTTYSIKYPILDKSEFFNTTHTVVATYHPSENGYIALYIDNTLVDVTPIGSDTIWENYGNQNLSLGWTPHNNRISKYYSGNVHSVNLANRNIVARINSISPTTKGQFPINMTLQSNALVPLYGLKLNAIHN